MKYLGLGHSIIPEDIINYDSSKLKSWDEIRNEEGYRLSFQKDMDGYLLFEVPGVDPIFDKYSHLIYMEPKYCDSKWGQINIEESEEFRKRFGYKTN